MKGIIDYNQKIKKSKTQKIKNTKNQIGKNRPQFCGKKKIENVFENFFSDYLYLIDK